MRELKINDSFKIINGSNLDVLPTIADNSIDAIVTDPPYELGFMNKKWDSTGIAYNIELWKQALRVLKPGGHLLAFGGTRTYHRIACAIEDAGFEIRDCIMWLYGSGFPKSHNVGLAVDDLNGVESKVIGNANYTAPSSANLYNPGEISDKEKIRIIPQLKEAQNEWNGWGTALKPAYEPVIMARKPISENTIAENCIKYRTGAINIDECRVGDEGGVAKVNIVENSGSKNCGFGCNGDLIDNGKGRFPANVITDGSDEVAAGMPITKSTYEEPNAEHTFKGNKDAFQYGYKRRIGSGFNDDGSALRYFYAAKASKKDRDDGLEKYLKKNVHPTVKPVELMQYLVRLVAPKGATVLDIFNGSGSTGKAVAFENRERNANYKYIGIELEEQYCEISVSRIDYGLNKYTYDMIKDIKEEEQRTGQMSLFDWNI